MIGSKNKNCQRHINRIKNPLKFGIMKKKLNNYKQLRYKKQNENPDYEMCVIFISDMLIGQSEFKDYKKYGPTNQIWVTSKSQRETLERYAGWIRDDEKIKEVYIDMVKN